MINKLMLGLGIGIGIGIIILIIISFGTIKQIETQQTNSIIEKISNQIRKINSYKKTIKIPNIKIPKFEIKRHVKDKVWVNGKTLKECMKGKNEINNNTVKCKSGYYKEIWIWR